MNNGYWLKSGFFTFFEKASVLLFGFGGFYFLVRIFPKEEFGLWALFLTVTTLVEFSRVGLIQNAVVKYVATSHEDEMPNIISASFFLNISLTVLSVIALFVLAKPLSVYWQKPQLEDMMHWYALTTIALALFGPAVFAHGYKIGDIEIGHPWTRATPPSAKVAGGYLTITNKGTTEDRLLSATFIGSATTEVHEMAHENGVMKMRELPKGIIIKAGEKIELRPGGFHLMFINLNLGLKQDETIKGVLVFEKAGRVEVEFKVESMGHRPKGESEHNH